MLSTAHPEVYLRSAYVLARDESDDVVTHNGAVIISGIDGRVVGQGANGFPEGVSPSTERLQSPLKYKYMIHAEQKAIIDAGRRGIPLHFSTMYCPWAPCTDCAKLIIASGIRRLVVHKQMSEKTTERWKDDIAIAVEMLAEGGVEYEQFDGRIGYVTHLFDGETWNP